MSRQILNTSSAKRGIPTALAMTDGLNHPHPNETSRDGSRRRRDDGGVRMTVVAAMTNSGN